MRRAGLLLPLLVGGCFYVGPINDAPPPPEQAPVIELAYPSVRSVTACPSSNGECQPPGTEASQCLISIDLQEVVDPNGVPLTARIFLNDGNPDAAQQLDATSLPLQLGSTTDFQLAPASTEHPTLMQLALPLIDLVPFGAYLVTGSGGVNYIEVVVSDGFNDANFPADPNAFRDPAPGKSTASAFWLIDLSPCSGVLL